MSWTSQKLEELRAEYSSADGGTMREPHNQMIADLIFSEGGRRVFPYAGISTLLDAPAKTIDWTAPDFGNIQVALFGVPMDLAVTNRNGSRFGPRALRSTERVGPYNDARRLIE